MRNRHRFHEVRLKARLYCGFDLTAPSYRGVGTPLATQPRALRRQTAIDHPILSENVGEIRLGEPLDDLRTADAGDAETRKSLTKARLIGPQLAADLGTLNL